MNSLVKMPLVAAVLLAPALVASTLAVAAEQAPTQAKMKEVLTSYATNLSAGNADAVIALYADDATVEDPLGSPVKNGKKDIEAFIRGSVKAGVKYDIVIPIRASNTNVAAMSIKATVGTAMSADVTEVFTFNPDGKISSMKGIWGSENRTTPAK